MIWRYEDMRISGSDDMTISGYQDPMILRSYDLTILRSDDLKIWQFDELRIWRHEDLRIWPSGDLTILSEGIYFLWIKGVVDFIMLPWTWDQIFLRSFFKIRINYPTNVTQWFDIQHALERIDVIPWKSGVGKISNFFSHSLVTFWRWKYATNAFDFRWTTVACKQSAPVIFLKKF